VVGFGVIPMINVYLIDHTTRNAHFYEEYVFEKENSIEEYLKQAVQQFYSKLHYQPEGDEKKTSLHEVLYRIDFPSSNHGKVMIQTSFTYLHWKIAQALEDEDSRYSIETLKED